MTDNSKIVGNDFFWMRVHDDLPRTRIGFHTFPFEAPYRPIEIADADGRLAYVEIVDGALTAGGDLPMDDAARIFLTHVSVIIRQAIEQEHERAMTGGDTNPRTLPS